MVAGLEEVDRRKAAGDQQLLHVRLRVAGEEKAPALERPQQHDRRVVHRRSRRRSPRRGRGPRRARARRRRSRRGRSGRPSTSRPDVAPRAARTASERLVAGAAPGHPGLDDPSHAVALEDERQARNVVLVRVREHDQVDAAVPGRHAGVEGNEQAVGIGAAVDEHPAPGRTGDEDRVALADVEHHDVGAAVGARRSGHDQDRDREHGEEAGPAQESRRPPIPLPPAAPAAASGRRLERGPASLPRRGSGTLRRGSHPSARAERRRPRVATNARMRRRRTSAARPATSRPAATAAAAGGRVTLANGRAAASRTIPISSPSTSAPGMPARVATSPGAPIAASAPPASASVPAAIATGTRGTTARFVRGDSGATRPKASRTIGSVAACAARETPSPSRTQPGSQRRRGARSPSVSGATRR